MIHVDLYWIGAERPFCSTGFFPGAIGRTWTWTKETIAHELECDEDDIDINDDDQITVNGKPVAISKTRVTPTERPEPLYVPQRIRGM